MREVPLSILMPYRDAAQTLDEALASVLMERTPEFELIVIDDGSKDSGSNIVKSWAARDARVLCVEGSGGGIADALKRGMSHSRAPFVARMDSDDISLPGRFARTLAELNRDERLAAVGTRAEAFPSDVVQEGMRRFVEWQNTLIDPNDHHREIFIDAPLCNPSCTIRRSAIERVGGYLDDGTAEDYSLWLRLDEAHFGLAKLPWVGLRWRHGAGRATFTQQQLGREQMRALKSGFLARRCLADGRPVTIWGAGRDGKRTARALEQHGLWARRFVDIDSKKIGRTARGVPVESTGDLDPRREFVIASVAARGARQAIRLHLNALEFSEGADFLCTA
ncbi:MAG: glycosyltransferase [Deltaproteobacteria bacterium]|nr:glycosyltransferase [Deltaproteobacteria bacterium]